MSDQANPDLAVEVAELRPRPAEAETALEAIHRSDGDAPTSLCRFRWQVSARF